MADATLSGYKAAAASIAWTSGQSLASLTDNEWTDLSDEIDNSTNKYLFADLELVLGSAAFTGADSAIEIYLVPSVDGTNYPDWTGNVTSDEQENDIHFVGAVTTSGATAAQRLVFRNIALPNGKYKYAFRNKANVTLAASGNTAKWRPHQYASA
jgi:hypothetical protein